MNRLNLPKEELERLYLKEKLNSYEIGRRMSCSYVTVIRYLHLYSIPIRKPLDWIKPFPSGQAHPNYGKQGFFKGRHHTEEARKKIREEMQER